MLLFDKFAKELSNPLVLIGFGLLILYYIIKNLFKTKLLIKLSKNVSEKIVIRIFNYLLIFVLLIIVFGFALKVFIIVNNQKEKQSKNDSALTEEVENVIQDKTVHSSFEDVKVENSIVEEKNEYIEFFPIKDLDKKIETFSFNSTGSALNLVFRSIYWNFDVKFSVSEDFLIKDLKSAIIRHFELNKYVKFNSYDGELEITWLMFANHRLIENEYQTLIEAGIKNNDILLIRILTDYHEVADVSMTEVVE